MKKTLYIIVTIVLFMSAVTGCSSGENSESSIPLDINPVESSIQISNEISAENPIQISNETSAPSSEISDKEIQEGSSINEISLPYGINETSNKNKLRYTNSVLSLSVTFPSDFRIVNNDYNPTYGIYLQNTEGTATLLIESVESSTVSSSDIANSLFEKYPNSDIYITDYRDVVCKRTGSDLNGNKLMFFLKMKPKSGGYNEILLVCGINDKDKFESVFNQINFSQT